MSTAGKLFIGWFGPRGLASIVFGVIILNAGLPGGGTLKEAIACTVLLSVVAHGTTANLLVKAVGTRLDDDRGKPLPEASGK
jgi:NhaP-type Na+/H+ or K+/H+ antiporter